MSALLWRKLHNVLLTGASIVRKGGSLDVESGASLKIAGTTINATAAEINRAADVSARIINATASTLTVTEATHDGALITLNRAAGIAVTLPAATGSGASFRFFIGTTVTSNSTTIKVANSSDTMVGGVVIMQDAGSTNIAFEAGGTDDTITGNGTTTGGIKGDYWEVIDVAANLWYVRGLVSGTGAEATPFSATV